MLAPYFGPPVQIFDVVGDHGLGPGDRVIPGRAKCPCPGVMLQDLNYDIRDSVLSILLISRVRKRIAEPISLMFNAKLPRVRINPRTARFVVGRHRDGPFLFTLRAGKQRCRSQDHPRGGSRRINTQISSRASSADKRQYRGSVHKSVQKVETLFGRRQAKSHRRGMGDERGHGDGRGPDGRSARRGRLHNAWTRENSQRSRLLSVTDAARSGLTLIPTFSQLQRSGNLGPLRPPQAE